MNSLPQSLKSALEKIPVGALKKMLGLVTGKNCSGRKAEIIEKIYELMGKNDNLRRIYSNLDSWQSIAVSETVHAINSHFDADRFMAKYGNIPSWGNIDTCHPDPGFINFIFFSQTIPDDLKEQLKRFVPKPKVSVLPTSENLPDSYELQETKWDPSVKKSVSSVQALKISVIETEICVAHELPAILRMIDANKLQVSDKTRFPSTATMHSLTSLLYGGDYYDDSKSIVKYDKIGPIKGFAWPLIVQGTGLAKLSDKKLQLTRAGKKALTNPLELTLRGMWDQWLKTKLIDEFRRIDNIKGQTGKGKRGFTALSERRWVINDALCECPIGKWVKVDDLFSYMRSVDLNFELHRDTWNLYIGESGYGSLGYDGAHNWTVLEGRYILCLLFEYAATMGLIDIGFVPPYNIRDDYTDNWGVDSFEFLSRYDGLLYIRLNALGAYCLGLEDNYQLKLLEPSNTLQVLPNLNIVVHHKQLLPGDTSLLDTFTVKTSDVVWKIEQKTLLSAIEKGHDINMFIKWLDSRNKDPLPNPVVRLLDDVKERSLALSTLETAKIIQCPSKELASLIANDTNTKKYCSLLGRDQLLIPQAFETKFRSAVRKIGYILHK